MDIGLVDNSLDEFFTLVLVDFFVFVSVSLRIIAPFTQIILQLIKNRLQSNFVIHQFFIQNLQHITTLKLFGCYITEINILLWISTCAKWSLPNITWSILQWTNLSLVISWSCSHFIKINLEEFEFNQGINWHLLAIDSGLKLFQLSLFLLITLKAKIFISAMYPNPYKQLLLVIELYGPFQFVWNCLELTECWKERLHVIVSFAQIFIVNW